MGVFFFKEFLKLKHFAYQTEAAGRFGSFTGLAEDLQKGELQSRAGKSFWSPQGHCYHGPLCAESARGANVPCGLSKERPAVSVTRDLPAQYALAGGGGPSRPVGHHTGRSWHTTSPTLAWTRTSDVQNIRMDTCGSLGQDALTLVKILNEGSYILHFGICHKSLRSNKSWPPAELSGKGLQITSTLESAPQSYSSPDLSPPRLWGIDSRLRCLIPSANCRPGPSQMNPTEG